MRTNPTHTIPSLSGTFGIPARLAHNPKMPKEPSSPSRTNTRTERCNKYRDDKKTNKGQLVTFCISNSGESADFKVCNPPILYHGLKGKHQANRYCSYNLPLWPILKKINTDKIRIIYRYFEKLDYLCSNKIRIKYG